MAVIFGAWLGQLMNKTGVTENIIKKSAELGGDRPLVVTLIMVVAVAILFTTLSGWLYHYGWLHRAAYSGVGRRSGYQRSVHFPNGIHHGPHV